MKKIEIEIKLNIGTIYVIFFTVVGSRLHSLNVSGSDTDFKGVFIWSLEDQFKLDPLPNLFNKQKKELKEDMDTIRRVLSHELSIEVDEDCELIELKKFIKNSLASEPNTLDMLHAEKSSIEAIKIQTLEFEKIKKIRSMFLNKKQAYERFSNTSRSFIYKSKEMNSSKTLAKSLQYAYSFENLIEGTFSPVLPPEKRHEVFNIRIGKLTPEVIEKVQLKSKEIFDRYKNFNYPEHSGISKRGLDQLYFEINQGILRF